ncbi:MAG: M67 family metallopeptidase [Acidobacteria bacterium]|nr:M67 family metallopeptidase [Acidobacteriota bacterium]
MIFRLRQAQVAEMCAHARASSPAECCGLVGGRGLEAQSIYPLRNVAAAPLVAYEGAPAELFAAQRRMRERGEQLVAIYHSHPRAIDPVPSETDVRLAFYPAAIYFIIGLGGGEAALRAFRIFESERRWERVEYRVVGE